MENRKLSNIIKILAGTSAVPVPGGGLLASTFEKLKANNISKIIFVYLTIRQSFRCNFVIVLNINRL